LPSSFIAALSELIKVPFPLPEAPQSADPLAADIRRKLRPKPVPPVPYGLVANIDAARGEKFFHDPQTQRKADVHHFGQSIASKRAY